MEQRTFDELISDFNSTISKWGIDLKYKFQLLGMIANIGYEHEKMLNNLPSAQPEIVRCKDCVNAEERGCALFCGFWVRYTSHKGYCFKAERRTNEPNRQQ